MWKRVWLPAKAFCGEAKYNSPTYKPCPQCCRDDKEDLHLTIECVTDKKSNAKLEKSTFKVDQKHLYK